MYKKISIAILVVVALTTAFFAYQTSQTKYDYNFEAFFPKNDPDTDFFLNYRDQFGTDNDFVLIALHNNKGIFDQTFLKKVKKLSDTLKTITDVKSVVSPVELNEITRDPLMGMVEEIPYLRWENPETYAIDSVRIFQAPELVGSLFSRDGKSLCIILNHTEKIDDDECTRLTNNLNNVMPGFGFDEYHVAGRSVGQTYYTTLIKGELVIMLIVSFLLMVVLMVLIYRSAMGVILPILVVGILVVWMMGLMHLTGKRIDAMANAIPTILVVTGLSVAIHIITKYLDHLKEGWSKFDSIKDTITHVGLANIFTTITTVVGFGSLATTGIKPIDDFGIYTAIGVALSFIIAYSLMPAILFLLPEPKKKISSRQPKMTWNNILNSMFTFVTRFKFWILGFTVAIVVGMFWGMAQIKENTFLMEDMNDKTKIKQDFNYFGEHYQGTRAFELSVTVKDTAKTLFDRDVLEALDKMESELKTIYGLNFIISPVALVKSANRSYAGGDTSGYIIPESDAKLRKISKEIMAMQNTTMIKGVISKDFRSTRIRSMLKDVGSNEAFKMNQAFYEYMKNQQLDQLITYKLTGTAELIDKNNRNLAWNIATGIIIAFVLISIIFYILFRSFKMVIIGLIPNIIPLIMLAGIMGYFNINLKISTAVLFTIAFGIAVDDTIHFLSKFRYEIKQDKSVLYALKRTYLTTGKAMIITSIILCLGFGVLSISSFVATQVIGSLTALTLFFALINDLTVLPILILLFYRKKEKVDELLKD